MVLVTITWPGVTSRIGSTLNGIMLEAHDRRSYDGDSCTEASTESVPGDPRTLDAVSSEGHSTHDPSFESTPSEDPTSESPTPGNPSTVIGTSVMLRT